MVEVFQLLILMRGSSRDRAPTAGKVDAIPKKSGVSGNTPPDSLPTIVQLIDPIAFGTR